MGFPRVKLIGREILICQGLLFCHTNYRSNVFNNEDGKVSSSEVTKVDSFGRDVRMHSREGQEGSSWGAYPPLQKDGFGAQGISKRQAEVAKSGSNSSIVADVKLYGAAMERHAPKMPNLGDWEDGERMVERITTFESSNSEEKGSPHMMNNEAVSTGLSQAKVPVKLQFGSFSSPSLIPSPVLTIQIGYIQMPLLHPHVGPSLTHLHPVWPAEIYISHFPACTPFGPQSVPFVQPNKPAKLSTNQNIGVSQPIQPKQETSAHNMMKSDVLSRLVDNQLGLVQGHMDLSQGNVLNEGNRKRTIHSGEDVDAPLQSGIVCVFEQPGIEAPSDEDDFIEVRPKRQMLNNQHEQREKEIKAKSRVTKVLM
ncbi:hypothetical protein Q3G72_015850 [Acer saccharum]|nr:hypothetical protein Q3G72_015850 [Acer saccharum]